MPDDYYISQYSGEEIDALLGGAGAGTVRYDAAQTLTDAQKTQARGNIGAAPSGYGLGTTDVTLTASDDLDNVIGNGWYYWGASTPANTPSLISSGSGASYCSMFVVSDVQFVISYNDRNNVAMRTKNYKGWLPWEYVNPALVLGVEYRTTERYQGKPVYVKVVNFGALPANNNKVVQHGISNYVQAIKYDLVGANDNACITNFPGISGIYSGAVDITIITTSDVSGKSVNVIIYYTTS